MDRATLDTVFFQAISLWINVHSPAVYALSPDGICTIGYDLDGHAVIDSWLTSDAPQPLISDLEAYSLVTVNDYWNNVAVLPQSIGQYSNFIIFPNNAARDAVPVSLLRDGNLCVVGSSLQVLVSGVWHAITYS